GNVPGKKGTDHGEGRVEQLRRNPFVLGAAAAERLEQSCGGSAANLYRNGRTAIRDDCLCAKDLCEQTRSSFYELPFVMTIGENHETAVTATCMHPKRTPRTEHPHQPRQVGRAAAALCDARAPPR